MSRPGVALAAALLPLAAAAQQPVVRTILDNGPTASRYDLVILGDGYQAHEQARFDQDVTTLLVDLFQTQPYATFGSYFNVHSVFRASNDSGASHPDADPPIVRDTAYRSAYDTGGTDRCLYVQDATQALMDAALAPANESRVIVLVNDERYGGCAAQFSVSYNGASMTAVQIHELGHSIATLADEYDYPNDLYTGTEPTRSNITKDALGTKWSHWWGTDGVSSFEGAGYHRRGLYRPRIDCLMRSLGAPLCGVCKEQISRSINAVVDTIEAPQPSSASVAVVAPDAQRFSFTNLVPPGNGVQITWSLDGQPLAGVTGTEFLLDPDTVSPGEHTLTVAVRDLSPFVRSDPDGRMIDTHSWSVSVSDPGAGNLRVADVSTTPDAAGPATPVTVRTVVHNDGPGDCADVTLEHFLSADDVLDAGDLYLGGTKVAWIAADTATEVERTVHLPFLMEPAAHRLLAVIDRGNAITEADEADNTGAVWFTGLADCTPAIEYRDPLLHPRDGASLSLATGGQVQPTVVARCASPGALYLIVWGCSGTAPGTQLLPGLTVPLNMDACTHLGLQHLNGPVFQQFYGQLDASGIGRATFAWPPGLPLQPMAGHFAALLIDVSPAPAFAAVTAPIAIELQ